MSKEQTAGKQNSRGIGIRWKLAGYLVLFCVFILIVFWFFQIFMLDSFYEWSKKDQMKNTLSRVEEALLNETEEDIQYLIEDLAGAEQLNIVLYEIGDNGEVTEKASSAKRFTPMLWQSDPEKIMNLYTKALESKDKTVSEKFVMNPSNHHDNLNDVSSETEKEMVFDEDGKPKLPDGWMPGTFGNTEIPSLFMLRAASSDGVSYAITVCAELKPLQSTVATWQRQFFIIVAIVIVGGILLALVLAHFISKPIIRMNRSAKWLAKGHFDADFSTKGFREARELSDSLNEAAEELSKTDTLQKELIANISHDLRTPLTMIKGYAEVVRDIPGEDTAENMQVIIDETTRMSELVNDLMDLSKLQSGVRHINPEIFDLTTLISEVMFRYEKLTEHDGYHIEFVPMSQAYVKADRTMILQVVYNFINNAVNYTGDDLTVKVTETIGPKTVRISVTDTGQGIEPELIPQIWDRYYKVDKVHRRMMVGTGLGLSICKKILLSHNAAFGVESTPGKGSTFWFELPLCPPDDRDMPDRPESSADR